MADISVEDALKGLLEMFPDCEHQITYQQTIFGSRTTVTILGTTTANTSYEQLFRQGASLSDCIAQVREWKAENHG